MKAITEKVVMRDSDEAAQLKTVTGWVSRDGLFFGEDERTARWSGCTHETCESCGEVIPRGWCKSCREKKDAAAWAVAERMPYDGVAMLYSDSYDRYFQNEEEALELAEDENCEIDDLRLFICEPVYGRPIDSDYFCDELPGDGELPDSIISAMDALNQTIKDAGPLSWQPGKYVPLLT